MANLRRSQVASEIMLEELDSDIHPSDLSPDEVMQAVEARLTSHMQFLLLQYYGLMGPALRREVEAGPPSASMRMEAIKKWLKIGTVHSFIERNMDKDQAWTLAQETILQKPGRGFVHLKFQEGDIEDELQRHSKARPVERVGWSPHGYHREHNTYLEKPLHQMVYMKQASSMTPVGLVTERVRQGGQKVLDMCAAPGGKSIEIASLLSGDRHSNLLINDISGDRMTIMRRVLTDHGIEKSDTRYGYDSLDGRKFGTLFPNTFDVVLVDVPCSGLGNLYDGDEFILPTPTFAGELNSNKQVPLLQSAIDATVPGGLIVYSTCTLNPEENELTINKVKKLRGESLEIVDPRSVLPSSPEWPVDKAVAASEAMQRTFGKERDPQRRIKTPFPAMRLDALTSPGRTTGFFAALLRKKR